jgi:putative heme iron utilization protein
VSRPTEHGGGEASAPIAGDPSTFPDDAQLARTLVHGGGRATLSTLTPKDYPYGSAVSFSVDDDGNPVVLVSEMAEHTVNMRHSPKASLLVAAETPEGQDPLSTARLTLVGQVEHVEEPGSLKTGYLEAHPHAAYYADFTDFGFWRLVVEELRFVGGFGHMSWVKAPRYAAATPDPIAPVAADVIEHMNDDHSAANLMYVQHLAGLTDATEATMVGIDCNGVTLQAVTPAGPRQARLGFPAPLTSADDARPAVIALLDEARSRASG